MDIKKLYEMRMKLIKQINEAEELEKNKVFVTSDDLKTLQEVFDEEHNELVELRKENKKIKEYNKTVGETCTELLNQKKEREEREETAIMTVYELSMLKNKAIKRLQDYIPSVMEPLCRNCQQVKQHNDDYKCEKGDYEYHSYCDRCKLNDPVYKSLKEKYTKIYDQLESKNIRYPYYEIIEGNKIYKNLEHFNCPIYNIEEMIKDHNVMDNLRGKKCITHLRVDDEDIIETSFNEIKKSLNYSRKFDAMMKAKNEILIFKKANDNKVTEMKRKSNKLNNEFEREFKSGDLSKKQEYIYL